jgi:multicomponent Na+:H+ antiporter subunit D
MGKITLFFCAGAIFVASHKKNVSEMDGLGRTMPFTLAAFFVGSMSIIGLPPTGGAWSKWYLALGAAEGHHAVFVGVLMVSSLLSIGYLMPVVGRAFFLSPSSDSSDAGNLDGKTTAGGFWSNLREAPLLCLAPLCATAAGCVVLFFYAPDVLGLLQTMRLGR